MRMVRPFFLFALFGALLFESLTPAKASAAGPDQFIAGLGERVLKIVTDDSADPHNREKIFRDMFQNAFAVEDISRFVLGRHWRTATEDQREQFMKAFEDYAVKTYGSRFSQYSGEKFLVRDTRPAGDQGDQMVGTLIERPSGGPPLRIDWRVRQVADGWRIVDIHVEGVSMAITQRQEYAAVLQQSNGNLSALVDKIKARTGTN